MLTIHKETTGQGAAVLKLAGDVTVEDSEQLQQALLAELRDQDRLMLNCESATSFDFFAIQMLCSAHRTSISWNKLLTWQGSLPAVVMSAMQTAGFARHHGCNLCPDGVCCMWS